MTELVDGFEAQIALLVTNVGLVFVGVLGLIALIALARFIQNRIRGAIK